MDDKKAYENFFHIHVSTQNEESKTHCSLKRIDNIKHGFSFFMFYQHTGTLGHNYEGMARIRKINLENRKLW